MNHYGRATPAGTTASTLKITVYVAIFVVVALVLLMGGLIYKMVSDPEFAKNLVGHIEGLGSTTLAASSGSKGSAIGRWWSRQDTTSRVIVIILGVLVLSLVIIFGVVPFILKVRAEKRYDAIKQEVTMMIASSPTRQAIEDSDLSFHDWMQVVHDARMHRYQPVLMPKSVKPKTDVSPEFNQTIIDILEIKGKGRYDNIIQVLKGGLTGPDENAKIRRAVRDFVTHYGTNPVAMERLEKQLALTDHDIPEPEFQEGRPRENLKNVLQGRPRIGQI